MGAKFCFWPNSAISSATVRIWRALVPLARTKKSQTGEIPVTSSTTTPWQRVLAASFAASIANCLAAARRCVWELSEVFADFSTVAVALERAIRHLLGRVMFAPIVYAAETKMSRSEITPMVEAAVRGGLRFRNV
jgi:hypothetical protein